MGQRNSSASSFLLSKATILWALGYFWLGLIVSFQLSNHWAIALSIVLALGWDCAFFCVVTETKTLIENKIAVLAGAEARAKEQFQFSRFTRDGIEAQTLNRARKLAEVALKPLTLAFLASLILLIGLLLSFFFIMVDSTNSPLFVIATIWIGTSVYWLPDILPSPHKRYSIFCTGFYQIGLSATLGLLLGRSLGWLLRNLQ